LGWLLEGSDNCPSGWSTAFLSMDDAAGRYAIYLQHFVLVFFGGLVAQLLRNDLKIRQLSPLCEVPVCPNVIQYTGYVQKPSRILAVPSHWGC
jgi:hypothetical protein